MRIHFDPQDKELYLTFEQGSLEVEIGGRIDRVSVGYNDVTTIHFWSIGEARIRFEKEGKNHYFVESKFGFTDVTVEIEEQDFEALRTVLLKGGYNV